MLEIVLLLLLAVLCKPVLLSQCIPFSKHTLMASPIYLRFNKLFVFSIWFTWIDCSLYISVLYDFFPLFLFFFLFVASLFSTLHEAPRNSLGMGLKSSMGERNEIVVQGGELRDVGVSDGGQRVLCTQKFDASPLSDGCIVNWDQLGYKLQRAKNRSPWAAENLHRNKPGRKVIRGEIFKKLMTLFLQYLRPLYVNFRYDEYTVKYCMDKLQRYLFSIFFFYVISKRNVQCIVFEFFHFHLNFREYKPWTQDF